MCHCIQFFVFNSLHTLALTSASDIDKIFLRTFFERHSLFFIKAHILSCSNILLLFQFEFEF